MNENNIDPTGTSLNAATEYQSDYEQRQKMMRRQKAMEAYDRTQNATEPTQGDLSPAEAVQPEAEVNVQGEQNAPVTPEENNEEPSSLIGNVAGALGYMIEGAREMPSQAVGGVMDAINEGLDLADEFGGLMEDQFGIPNVQLDLTNEVPGEFFINSEQAAEAGMKNFELPTTNETDNAIGGFTRSGARFLTGFLPALRAAKALKAPILAKELGASALASAVVFDPYEDRLATLLNEVPVLDSVVPDWLADNNPENQSTWEGRFKNAVEDAGLGVMFESLLRAMKAYKVQRKVVDQSKMLDTPTAEMERLKAKEVMNAANADDGVLPVSEADVMALGDAQGSVIEMIDEDAIAADVFKARRNETNLRLIEQSLPDGYKVREVKDGISILDKNGKRVAVAEKPSAVNEDYINAIQGRIERQGGVEKALTAIDNAQAKIVSENDKVRLVDGREFYYGSEVPGGLKGKDLTSWKKKMRDDAMTKRKDPMDDLIRQAKGETIKNGPAVKTPKKPVAMMLKARGGVDPESPLASEMRNVGITNKSMPGVFRKGGMKNADEIPVEDDELLQMIGGDGSGMDNVGMVDHNNLIDALKRESMGDPLLTPSQRQAMEEASGADENVYQFQQALDDMGIDYENMDVDQIKTKIDEVKAEQDRLQAMNDVPEAEFGSPRTLDDLNAEGSDIAGDFKITKEYLKKPEISKHLPEQKFSYPKNLYRGVSDNSGGGMATYGQGLYMTGDQSVAKKYGDVVEMDRGELPDNPIVFENKDQFENFLGAVADDLGLKRNNLGFERDDLMRSMGYDGAIIKDHNIIVSYDVKGLGDPLLVKRGGDRAAKAQKVFVNMNRIQAPDDIKAAIQELANADADAINAKGRGKVTNAQTIKESDKEYTDLNDLIGRAPGPMSAAEAVASRKLLNSSAEQLVDLARRAKSPEATKADIYNFRRGMSVHYAIQSEVIAARRETARALQSWAIPAGTDKQRGQMIDTLIGSVGGNGDLRKLAMAISDVDSMVGVNDIVKQSMGGKVGKAAYQMWINGLLSSPKTHMVNILSNALTATWAVPERFLAAGVSKAFYDGEIASGEAASIAYGMTKGIRDGIKLVVKGQKAAGLEDVGDIFDAFAKVEDVYEDMLSAEAWKVSENSVFGKGINYMGKALNAPTNLLGKEDQFFKAVAYRMELQSRAYREAASQGLEGDDMADFMADFLRNPPDDINAESLDFAHYQTFTNELGEKGKAFQQMANKVPGARIVVPFIRTPTNIIKYTFARTPLAYMSANVRAEIAAGGAKAAQAHARIALGSMLMLTAADMTAEGTFTGGGPADPKLKEALYRQGWQPYSVKIDGKYVQYNRLDPIGLFMGLSADIQEITQYSDTSRGDELVTAGVMAFANNLASKTYLSGVYDFIAAVDPSNQTSDPGKYMMNLAGSIMPYSSFMRNITYTNDTTIRDPRTSAADPIAVEKFAGMPEGVAEYMTELVNTYRKQIPGLSDELPARRDLWGEPIDRASGFGAAFDLLSPMSARKGKESPIDKVIFDNQVKISHPARQIQGVELTGQEYSAYVEMAGKGAKEQLDRLVKLPVFKRLSDGPDGMKASQIENVIRTHRQIASKKMMMEFPELRARIMKKKMEKASMLKGQ